MLYAVRHGQSTANVAAVAGAHRETDDMAIGLTELGQRQGAAVGRQLVAMAPEARPELVLCSPYLRAVRTWQLAEAELRFAAIPLPCYQVHPRLYDRYRGQLAGLTSAAVRERFPGEAVKEARDPLGYRPPEGESFRDVAARLRGVVADLEADRQHRRVLIVAHDAVVLYLRQILENLDDTAILAITAEGLAGNGSFTTWRRISDGYRLESYDERGHLPAE
ncbi:histidine phosphatase family protein [Nocardia brasiliensis]|uniref:histidine phosphatase family protein n=1 Tax=Nocardia brasiliensis TaxID=37326 RepID=UPI0002527035|nr:histidine phosphatase family protein [Nocardia brasiliensis]OCF87401.1 hypothetical protein AW168_25855 [Nocardia brasiliensis]